jgi:hypothetical protein
LEFNTETEKPLAEDAPNVWSWIVFAGWEAVRNTDTGFRLIIILQ